MRTFAFALAIASVNAVYNAVATTDRWVRKSASDKKDYLWEKITEDTTSGRYNYLRIVTEDMNTSFDAPGDELPCTWMGCRKKALHSVGNVAQVKFRHTGNGNFTGMFGGDLDHGIMRLSSADYVPGPTSGDHITPGMGLKFLRDGMDSANLVAMYSVDGQDDLDFFANDWTTLIPAASLKLYIVAYEFFAATPYIQVCSLTDWAKYDQQGNSVEDPVFPYYLRFEPTGAVQLPSTWDKPYPEQLADIPAGTDLFRLYAWTAPEELGGEEIYIGDIITESAMPTSNWGDNHLYFRHERAEEAIAMQPTWAPYYPKFDPRHPLAGSKTMTAEQLDMHVAAAFQPTCPFSFLYKPLINSVHSDYTQ